jgi:hypothetical protein
MNLPPTPPGLLVPRLRSTHPAANPGEFFDVVEKALLLQLASEQTDRKLFFTHSFPKDRLAKPDQEFFGIVFRVLSSVMTPTDNSGSRVPRAPSVRQVVLDPHKTGYADVDFAWKETLTVEFKIYSKASDTRGELVHWFHRFFMRYAYLMKYFEGYGIDKIQFVGRGEDGYETQEMQEVYFGLLTYQCQLEYLETYSKRIIDSLTINASAGNDVLTINIPDNQT